MLYGSYYRKDHEIYRTWVALMDDNGRDTVRLHATPHRTAAVAAVCFGPRSCVFNPDFPQLLADVARA